MDTNRTYAEVVATYQPGTVGIPAVFDSTVPAATALYSHGNDLAVIQTDAGSYYPHADAQGNITALSGSGSSFTDRYSYDAWGTPLSTSGSTANPYRYSGEWWNPTLGHTYLRARSYSPRIGRFQTMDSWPGRPNEPITLNKYQYANANPAMGIDPSGNMSLSELNAIQKIQSLLHSSNTFFRLIEKAESILSVIDALDKLFMIIKGGSYKEIIQSFDLGKGTGKNSRNGVFNDPNFWRSASENYFKNASRITKGIYRYGMKDLKTFFKKAKSRKNARFLFYLPTGPLEFGPQINLDSPIKVLGIRVRLILSGGSGRVFGVGTSLSKNPSNTVQYFRMDWHPQHKPDSDRLWGSTSNGFRFHYHIRP